MDVIELHEAFAVQTLAVLRELDLPPDHTNPNGVASLLAILSARLAIFWW